jgi:hypothetical protein
VDRELIDASERLHRFFMTSFRAADIAMSLPTFSEETPDSEIVAAISRHHHTVAGLTHDGLVTGYLLRSLPADTAPTRHELQPEQVVHVDTSLAILVQRLETHSPVFVAMCGNVSGVVQRECLHKPPGRMWLFGILTLLEMRASIGVEIIFPNESWRERVSTGRMEKALQLQQERERAGHPCALLDCLQLTDKTDLLGRHEKCYELFGVESRRQFREAIKDIVALRNNLSHAQDFIPHDWPVVLMLAQTLEERLLAPKMPQLFQ